MVLIISTVVIVVTYYNNHSKQHPQNVGCPARDLMRGEQSGPTQQVTFLQYPGSRPAWALTFVLSGSPLLSCGSVFENLPLSSQPPSDQKGPGSLPLCAQE